MNYCNGEGQGVSDKARLFPVKAGFRTLCCQVFVVAPTQTFDIVKNEDANVLANQPVGNGIQTAQKMRPNEVNPIIPSDDD